MAVELANWTALVIDFRYHLVSIIAVFLALAVGLLVGSTALSGTATDVLRHAQSAAVARNEALNKANKQLSQQVSADQAFAQAGSQRLLGGLLAGENVVLVLAPNEDSDMVSAMTAALGRAGAKVTGQIQLTQQFMQTTGPVESSLTELAQSLAPQAAVNLPSQASDQAVAGQQDAAAVIAASLLARPGSSLARSGAQAILNGFARNGYLTVGPSGVTTPAPAGLAVLVTPAGQPPQTGNDSQVLVAVAQELQAAGDGTVMAGPVSAIGSGSAIQLENHAGQVSTVDNADTESGQIMVVQALRLLLDGKTPESYGIEPGAAPSPAPVPSVSPSTTVPGGTGG
jgi:Copper transport outer membrane protein, MctB